MDILILSIPLIVVITACAIVARGTAWVRILALILTVCLLSYMSYTLGIGVERGRFISSHLHWFAKYSAHLTTLAEQGKDDELKATILDFNNRFQKDPTSSTNITRIMHQILKIGSYYQPTNGTPNKALPPTQVQ